MDSPQSQSHSVSASMEMNGNRKDSQENIVKEKERIVIGAQYGINDAPPSMNKIKFNRLKNRFGHKMKEQMYKIQQNMVKNEIQKRKNSQPTSPTLNELNARDVIKETEKVLITKTK